MANAAAAIVFARAAVCETTPRLIVVGQRFMRLLLLYL